MAAAIVQCQACSIARKVLQIGGGVEAGAGDESGVSISPFW